MKEIKNSDRNYKIKSTYNKWLDFIIEDRSINSYLVKSNYFDVAIFGYGEIGELLAKYIMKNKNINLHYVLDNNAGNLVGDIVPIYKPGKELLLPEVDLIIVTVAFDGEAIKDTLKKEHRCEIITFEQLLSRL